MKFAKRLRENLQHRIRAVMPIEQEPKWKRVLAWLVAGGIAVFLIFLFIATIVVASLAIGLPDVRNFDKLAGIESTLIFDRSGGILYTIHGEENRKYVPLSEISQNLRKATVAIEDDQFFSHSGFDIPGILKAGLHEMFGIGSRRGGSTITQQLAKNAFLSSSRTYIRKIKELIIAVRLERAYDKQKILELYLNRIPYGNNAYGAEMAAKMYFGKSAQRLTLGESAILAALPKAPTYYSPYGPNLYSKLERDLNISDTANLPKTIRDLDGKDYSVGLIGREIAFSPNDKLYIPGRADIVLRRMADLAVITENEYQSAINEIRSIQFQRYREAIRAAHFVFYIRQMLEDQLGKDVVSQGGLRVYTTLDPKLQEAAEKAVTDQIAISKETHGVSTAALFSFNVKTCEVLAMVGSADYFDQEAHGNVNHVFARRQPGSSFKPIVYAKAFLNNYAPATVLYDTPTNFGAGYVPQNYEGRFRGPVSIRTALGQSRNIPALKAYFLAGQQGPIIELAQKMGISTLNPNGNYGPPLAIGAGEVTLADMVQAFSVFANNGIRKNYFAITKIVDKNGAVIFEKKPGDETAIEVLDPQAAYLINNILSDKSVWLGPRLNVPGQITAAKTGTSNKELSPAKILPSNLWTIGYTPTIAAGVWAGNSDGGALKLNADGYNVTAPIWAKFMAEALAGSPSESFPVPQGIRYVKVSRASGKLPGPDTPEYETASEIFASFSVPAEMDDIFVKVNVNKKDNLLPNQYTPQEYIESKLFKNHHDPISDYPSWLAGIRQWVTKQKEENPDYPDFPPAEETKMFTAENAASAPTIMISSPVAYSIINNSRVEVDVQINAPNGVEKVSYYLDERRIPNFTQFNPPYGGVIKFAKRARTGPHTIRAKVYDSVGYTAESVIEIQYQPEETSAGTTAPAFDSGGATNIAPAPEIP